jgi:hypothetical protein
MDVFPARTASRIPADLLVLGSQRTKNAPIVIPYAVLVGLIHALPHYWLWRDAGSEWAFPGFNVPDEQEANTGRIRALCDGERLGADMKSFACPEALAVFATTGEHLTRAVRRLFGAEMRGCFILADFLFPAAAIIGFYLFLRALSHLRRDNYRMRFEGKGTQIFEWLPSD